MSLEIDVIDTGGGRYVGDVDSTPEFAAKAVEDLTMMDVDPANGERLYKAALVRAELPS